MWFDHGDIKRTIAHFQYGIPGWKRKKVKPSTAKRVNQLTGLRLTQQINKNRILAEKIDEFNPEQFAWQNYTGKYNQTGSTSLSQLWLSQNNLTELHSDKSDSQLVLVLRLPQRLNRNLLENGGVSQKKTDFWSKCGRIYTWSLLQILSTPLYFRCSNWLLLVESFVVLYLWIVEEDPSLQVRGIGGRIVQKVKL